MKDDEFMWMIYGQLGTHMWYWRLKDCNEPHGHYSGTEITVYEDSFMKRMEKALACGATHAVLDIGEAIQYPSHPEIWLKGAWTAEHANAVVRKLKAMGFKGVYPSLNFATSHGFWLGEYSRMISTPIYYQVCRDLLKDAWEIFEKPAMIHYGMDEENVMYMNFHASKYNCLAVVRQGELYWHDNLFFIREIEKLGARAWLWGDMARHQPEEFAKHMPKSALMSNWYYQRTFDTSKITGTPDYVEWETKALQGYVALEKHGYDQLPTGSNYLSDGKMAAGEPPVTTNITGHVEWCLKNLTRSRFKGLMVSPWFGVTPKGDKGFFAACDQLAEAKKLYAETTAKEKQS